MNKPAARLLHPTLRLDRQSAMPLHAQAQQLLRQLISQPQYAAGALLPDEISLASRLGISRGTLRAGIERLVFEGVLERRAGVGTRVRPRQAESGIAAWRSFSREMAHKGIRVENFDQQFALVEPEEEAARALQLSSRTKVWRLDRVRGWDGLPVLRSRSWFHPRLGLTGKEDFSKPLYEVIERETGAVAEVAHEELLAVAASATMAKLLKVKPNEPLLLRSHSVFDAGGRPIEFAQVHYVSSRFALTLKLRRGQEQDT
jgi:GntR family transcriptional regulator